MLNLDDTSISEVNCFECHKPISSIPAWMAGATVKFQCEECRQKHPRIPGMADLEARRIVPDTDELSDLGDMPEDPDEEDMDEEVVEETD